MEVSREKRSRKTTSEKEKSLEHTGTARKFDKNFREIVLVMIGDKMRFYNLRFRRSTVASSVEITEFYCHGFFAKIPSN